MPQCLAKVYVHAVFSTKDRRPFITPQIQDKLYRCIGKVCHNIDCHVHQIGGVEDHIHILMELSRTITIAKLIEVIKSSSSRWVKQQFSEYQAFSWQRGYGVFSVDSVSYDAVKLYIVNQKQHHAKRSFKEEVLLLLKRYNIEYDDRYIWD